MPEFVQITTHRYHSVCVALKLYILLVAPVIFVQGPIAEGPLCHWKVNPPKTEAAAGFNDKLIKVPEQAVEDEAKEVNGPGVPAQAGGVNGFIVIK